MILIAASNTYNIHRFDIHCRVRLIKIGSAGRGKVFLYRNCLINISRLIGTFLTIPTIASLYKRFTIVCLDREALNFGPSLRQMRIYRVRDIIIAFFGIIRCLATRNHCLYLLLAKMRESLLVALG